MQRLLDHRHRSLVRALAISAAAGVAVRYLVSYGIFVLLTVHFTLGKWLAESVLGTRWQVYAPSIK